MADVNTLTIEEIEAAAAADEILEINTETRVIDVPVNYEFGVFNDKDVKTIYFKVPKTYNAVDLNDFQIRMVYMNASNEGNEYIVTNRLVYGSYLYFTWLLGRDLFKGEGKVRFIVCMRKFNSDGTTNKEFNTTIARGTVLGGLEVDDPTAEKYNLVAEINSMEALLECEEIQETVEAKAAETDATYQRMQELSATFGSPLVAATAAEMTNGSRVYVYVGNETGYTAGHWYYSDGSQWNDGGVYQSAGVALDTTLSVADKAADAKAVGDAITAEQTARTNADTALQTSLQTAIDNEATARTNAVNDVKSDLEQVRVAPRLASTDLNTVQTPGLYGLHSSQTYQHAPSVGTGAVGYLDVIVETSNGNPTAIFQCATYYKSDGDVVIYARRYSTWSQTWTDWDVADSYTDSTLTEEGVPADSKAVGDEIASVREEISEIDALSDEVKEALLACFEYVGWSSDNGDELRDNLYNALYGGSMAIQTLTYLRNQVKALAGSINSTTVSDVIELRVKTDQTNRLVIGMTDGDHKLKNMSGSAVDLYLIPVPSGANFVKVTTEGGYEGNPVDFYVCSMAYNSIVNDYEKVLWSSTSASGTKIDITGKAGDGIIVGVRLNTEVYPNPLDPNVISAKIEFFAS